MISIGKSAPLRFHTQLGLSCFRTLQRRTLTELLVLRSDWDWVKTRSLRAFAQNPKL